MRPRGLGRRTLERRARTHITRCCKQQTTARQAERGCYCSITHETTLLLSDNRSGFWASLQFLVLKCYRPMTSGSLPTFTSVSISFATEAADLLRRKYCMEYHRCRVGPCPGCIPSLFCGLYSTREGLRLPSSSIR